MRKFLSFALALLFVFQCFALCVNAEEDHPGYPPMGVDSEAYPYCTSEIVSSDGKYGYVINKENGDCYFSHSFEKNITVLNIPEEIDGHRIVGVIDGKAESCFTLAEVNYSKYIKDIYHGGMNFSLLPSCRINLNEGLETIHNGAYGIGSYNYYRNDQDIYYSEFNEHLDELIFPSTLKEIKYGAVAVNVKRIVFKGDPIVNMTFLPEEYDNFPMVNFKKEIYFTGDVENVDAFSFAEWIPDFDENNFTIWKLIYPRFINIYHKSGAKGFERFEQAVETDDFAERKPNVEEYTDEFWNEPESKVQVKSVVAEDMVIDLSKMDFDQPLKATVLPENADDTRVWYFLTEPTCLSLGMHGYLRDGENCTGLDGLAGQTVTVRAVAANGVYKDFQIRFEKGNIFSRIFKYLSDFFNALFSTINIFFSRLKNQI